MLAIYKRELRYYFTSIIGYVFMAFFLAIIGLYFYVRHLYAGHSNFEYTLSDVSFIFILLVPLLTMRLMAEEKKQKTDQLLYTSPLTAESIVAGKFLAVLTVLGSVMVIVCTYPLIISQYGQVPMPAAYASIFGFTLLGGAYLAMGLYISSLTENQIVAAVVSFVVFLLTALMEGIAKLFPTDNKTAFLAFAVLILVLFAVFYIMTKNIFLVITAGCISEIVLAVVYYMKPALFDGSIIRVFGWLSVASRFDSFFYGMMDFRDIIYYLSIIFLFLFLTTQVIRKKRWS